MSCTPYLRSTGTSQLKWENIDSIRDLAQDLNRVLAALERSTKGNTEKYELPAAFLERIDKLKKSVHASLVITLRVLTREES